ncbi:hypothetical protein PoB_007685400 [Plakobranchus ocellatus]|uniref:ShKT domain-containing protein n=1 Tax=Plakobranchus ocellatus TaxID=259542 RepID=A0AAV4E1J3_9GAST|nr:hypothetical protein PoB_007685400 [Plakobranchus ocellatus]
MKREKGERKENDDDVGDRCAADDNDDNNDNEALNSCDNHDHYDNDPGCSDTIPDCANYGGLSACVDYHAWASVRCREYCGFCSKFVIVNATTMNGISCPEWKLPVECTMDHHDGTCCPMPKCPDGFVLTAKREN